MSSKRDWNDVSDDDSEDQNNVSLDQITPLQQKQSSADCQLLKKSSEPIIQKKPISNQEENLIKLQNCSSQKIWLFVPSFYKNNVEDINNIINKIQNVFKIDKFIQGWNILIKRQSAKRLIIQGKKQQQFFIKFYFSKKNDQSLQNNYKSSHSNPNFNHYSNHNNNDKKVKYVPKSPNNKQQKIKISQLKQPDVPNIKLTKFYSHNDYQISSPRNNYKDKKDNKYHYQNKQSKFTQKQSKFTQKQSKYLNQNKKQIQKQSNSKQIQQNKLNNKPKYVAKRSQQQKSQSKNNQHQIDLSKKDSIKNQLKYQNQGQLKSLSPLKSSNNSPTKSPNDKKKKNKPKKKDQMLKDNNNPYSALGCY